MLERGSGGRCWGEVVGGEVAVGRGYGGNGEMVGRWEGDNIELVKRW